ncbi:hypothetical protein ACR784_14830 [Sphingobacterium multivorum]|uniref:hypothetical protein n=1 Tax=Sphingobacterium TaxID=28453 RepID=UPI002579EFFE|nr:MULTISPECIES: hypothetical protein [unclassified Sphingobacterium]
MTLKHVFYLFAFLCLTKASHAQYQTSEARTWDAFPSSVVKPGYGFNQSKVVAMEDGDEDVEVILFAKDAGHYPYFDLFRSYYVIIGYYSKEVKYTSSEVLSDKRELILEDRNKDGRFELYRRYLKDGKFTVDENGDNLRGQWVYDRIEFNKSK